MSSRTVLLAKLFCAKMCLIGWEQPANSLMKYTSRCQDWFCNAVIYTCIHDLGLFGGDSKNPLRFSATSHGGQSLPNIRCSHVCPHPWYPWPPERPEMMVVLQRPETANSFANLRPTRQHLELRWRWCFARTLGSFLHMQVHNFKLWNARVALILILSSIQRQRTLGVMPTLDLFSQHFCSCFPTHRFGAGDIVSNP